MFIEHFAHSESTKYIRLYNVCIFHKVFNALCLFCPAFFLWYCICICSVFVAYLFCICIVLASLPQQLMRIHYTYYLTQLLGSQPLIPLFPDWYCYCHIFFIGAFFSSSLIFFKILFFQPSLPSFPDWYCYHHNFFIASSFPLFLF